MLSEFWKLVRSDADRAGEMFIETLKLQAGSFGDTARALRVSERNLYRWVHRMNLWPKVDEWRKIRPGGRPRL